MNLLVVGGGGREHALIYKLKQSKLCEQIYCAPGNAGIAQLAECVDIKANDLEGLFKFAKENRIGLTVVGPEEPLVMGIADLFQDACMKIFGPNRQCAAFEGSKKRTKEFLFKYKIPTANYAKASTPDEAIDSLEKFSYPLVVKADGLAAGKGVLICKDKIEAIAAINDLMVKKTLGDAADTLVIEEYLDGVETSMLCFMDGKSIVPMASSKDYKRVGEGDMGLNTGGMGTYSPNPLITEKMMKRITDEILDPILNGFKAEGLEYKGVLYVGLMIVEGTPKVLEFNVRFGDPETQVLMLRLQSDLVEIMLNCSDGMLDPAKIKWSDQASVCVVAASEGYPAAYEKGKKITVSESLKDVTVFHAGTAFDKDGNIVTAGGRVLNVCATGETHEQARAKVYANIDKLHFDGMFYRKDIAKINRPS
jgi:phosphoribosylamine--glycine ligase